MLSHLHINNFALIDKLDIDFHNGFSVITGETGAGKSIILGAIALLTGSRADSKSIKDGASKCVIEAEFSIADYNLKEWFDENEIDYDPQYCIIRRELTSAGKSRGFINDTPSGIALMRELGEMLIDVHSQHQNLLLQKEDFQLNCIDIMAHSQSQLADFVLSYNAFNKANKELEQLKKEIADSNKQEEFMRFQLDELSKPMLVAGEQEDLEQEQKTASHLEDIKLALYEADNLLLGENNDALSAVHRATQRIDNIVEVFPKVNDISERLNSCYIELKDIADELTDTMDSVDYDPQRLQTVSERLDLIYNLERKYGFDSVEELIAERERLEKAVQNIDNSEVMLSDKEAEVTALLKDATEKAKVLTSLRVEAAKVVENKIIDMLTTLGMPNVQFCVEIKESKLTAKGADSVSFLFSANKGMAMRPISDVASGGEIARVMLSLKAMISSAVMLPTIIFDEIDTGVSGKIAEKMADIMREMGNSNRQVLSITHLPQIASKGKSHYKVEKSDTENGTQSVMRELSEDERVIEIAQMLSGENITEAAMINAKELLNKQ